MNGSSPGVGEVVGLFDSGEEGDTEELELELEGDTTVAEPEGDSTGLAVRPLPHAVSATSATSATSTEAATLT